MSKITYTVERLYHFNCHNCGGYFTLSDKLPKTTTCPHCQFKTVPEAGGKSLLLSVSGGLAARCLEDALVKGATIEIPSLGIKINKNGVIEPAK